jgi:hypothetical protein
MTSNFSKILMAFLILSFLPAVGICAHGTFGRTDAFGNYADGMRYIEVVITGDATDNGSATISVADLGYIKGGWVQEIISTPDGGATIPSAYTITVHDAYGRSVTTGARSTTTIESFDVPSNLGRNWNVIGALTITATGLGNGKKTTIRVTVW